MTHADRDPDEMMAGGVRIADADPDMRTLMADMVRALPDEMRQTMVSLQRDDGDGFVVAMEDGLDRAELTRPIADALVEALARAAMAAVVVAS